MDSKTSKILDSCKERIGGYYGPKLNSLMLYGSVARGEEDAESDIDLLAVLEPPFDFFSELKNLVSLVSDLQAESDHYISVRPAPADTYEAGYRQIYRNVKQEGFAV